MESQDPGIVASLLSGPGKLTPSQQVLERIKRDKERAVAELLELQEILGQSRSILHHN